ncbi:hypothetical protein MPER_03594, partial [Moniliophthora perniciosa FA553]
PFVIFSDRYLLYTYSFQTKTVNTILRGHGGHITSIALHPSLPHLFATTSRDFSVRVYDLTQKPREHADNPIWPPRTTPSLAGPAHGLDINGKEGTGMGRHYPIIATCGMDRSVKIWTYLHTPVQDDEGDTPLKRPIHDGFPAVTQIAGSPYLKV